MNRRNPIALAWIIQPQLDGHAPNRVSPDPRSFSHELPSREGGPNTVGTVQYGLPRRAKAGLILGYAPSEREIIRGMTRAWGCGEAGLEEDHAVACLFQTISGT